MLLACVAGIHDTGAARAAGVSPTAKIPRRLSETKIFRDLSTLEPSAGVIPYEVNAPFWSDGAVKQRWIVLPGDGTSVDPTEIESSSSRGFRGRSLPAPCSSNTSTGCPTKGIRHAASGSKPA